MSTNPSTDQKKKLIPEKTDPKTKFIRTGEGVLVFAFNVAMLVVPIVSSALSAGQAVKYAAILNGVAVVSRSGLKIAALIPKVTNVPAANVNMAVTDDSAKLIAAAVQQVLADTAKSPSADDVGNQVNADVDKLEQLLDDAQNGGGKAAELPPAPPAVPTPSPVVTTPTAGGVTAPATGGATAPAAGGATAPAAGPSEPAPPAAAGPASDVVSDAEEFASVPPDAELAAEVQGSSGPSPAMAAVGNPVIPNGGGQ